MQSSICHAFGFLFGDRFGVSKWHVSYAFRVRILQVLSDPAANDWLAGGCIIRMFACWCTHGTMPRSKHASSMIGLIHALIESQPFMHDCWHTCRMYVDCLYGLILITCNANISTVYVRIRPFQSNKAPVRSVPHNACMHDLFPRLNITDTQSMMTIVSS